MHNVALIFVWLLNFGISAWNAYAVGLAWVESKHAGGWPRAMAWAGAVMSAVGFSWCYLIVLAFIAHGLDWLSADDIALMLRLGYVLLIPAILASGLMITLDSWARAYRQRTIGSIGIAAWNTYAQIHNTFNAIRNYDQAFGSVLDALRNRGDSGSDKKDNGAGALILVFVLVIVALFSGALTTMVIIRRVAGNNPLPEQPGAEGSGQ
jgi:hypothetical protein